MPVGLLTTPSNPDFDVLVDSARNVIHFVGTDARRLRYLNSTDGGLTWSAPEDLGPGWAPRIAVDSKGEVHLVSGTDGPRGKKVTDTEGEGWYRVRTNGVWSAPVALVPPLTPHHMRRRGARVAVDGSDNVHIIYWAYPTDNKTLPWMELQRCVYQRKPAGQATFETPLLFRHGKDASGGGSAGDLAVDRNGDVHIIYGSWNGKKVRTTHFVRRKDGTWGDKVDDWVQTNTDFTMKAAVGPDDVIHVTGLDRATLNWTYWNTRSDPGALKPEHVVEDDWEINADILVTPNNDVWIARENHYDDNPEYPEKGFTGKFRDKSGWYARFDAARSTWGPRTRVSPPGTENSDSQNTQAPRFIRYGGEVRVFYAERKPGQPFSYHQRILSSRGASLP